MKMLRILEEYKLQKVYISFKFDILIMHLIEYGEICKNLYIFEKSFIKL